MDLFFGFLAGAFAANSVPHLVAGMLGNTHMTPFSKDSSATLNVMWGFLNLLFGLWLLAYSGRSIADALSMDTYSWGFLAGILVIAVACAMLFSNKNARFPWFK